MHFSPADITAMIDAMGTTCLIGINPATGVFSTPGKAVDLQTGSIITTEPSLLVDQATADLVIENSTIITINNVDYQATDKMPDGAGFIALSLTTDF